MMRTTIWTHPSAPGRHFTKPEYLDFMRVRRRIRMTNARLTAEKLRAENLLIDMRDRASSFDEVSQVLLNNQWALRILVGDPTLKLDSFVIKSSNDWNTDAWTISVLWKGRGLTWQQLSQTERDADDRRAQYRLPRTIVGRYYSFSDVLRHIGLTNLSGQSGVEEGRMSGRALKALFPSIVVMEKMMTPARQMATTF